VSARRLQDLEVTGDGLPSPGVVTDAPRQLSAAELLDSVAEPRAELPEPAEGPPAADEASRRTA
jgi:hypothetical protein